MDMTNIVTPDKDLFQNLKQIGIVVKDAKKAVKFCEEMFGWELCNTAVLKGEDIIYRGGQGKGGANLYFFKTAHVMVEFIEPDGKGESVWQNFLDTRGQGIICALFDVNNLGKIKEMMAAKNIEIAQSGASARFEGVTWNYIDTLEEFGFYINVFNPSEFGF